MSEYNQAGGGQPQRTGHIMQAFDQVILGAPVSGAQKPPRLTFSFWKGKPSISVKTNAPNDMQDNGNIRAEPTNPDFYALLSCIEWLIKNPGENKFTCTLKAKRRVKGGQLSDEKMVAVRMLVGRDANDVIYMAVMSWNKDRPVIKFPFLPVNDNFAEANWGDKEGNPLPNSKISEFYAQGWLDQLRQHIPVLTRDSYEPPKPRDNNGGGYNRNAGGGGGGGGNSGGYNRGGGNAGGGGAAPAAGGADFGGFEDDDLPF
jgi:uncharacterized membrane protein YgcG